MAKCKECTKEFGIFELTKGRCKDCILKETPECLGCGNLFNKELLNNRLCKQCNAKELEKLDKKLKIITKENSIGDIILTTETVVDFKIKKRLDIITAECVLGMNLFKDMFSGVRDIVGGRSNTVQKTLREAKNTVLDELKKEAYSIGANAVVAVDLDYSEFTGGGKTMLFIVASGTAVIKEEEKNTN